MNRQLMVLDEPLPGFELRCESVLRSGSYDWVCAGARHGDHRHFYIRR